MRAHHGAIEKSSETIVMGQEAVSDVLLYVRSGYGFYEDGSFVQQKHVANTGSHGSMLLDAVTDVLSVLDDSRWRVTDPNQHNVHRWVRESIVPFMYRGAMMDNVRGRSITRPDSQDHVVGRQVATVMARLSAVAEPHEAEYLKRVVKRWVTEDTTFTNYYAGLNVADAIRVKAIVSDYSVPLDDELLMNKIYASMDRAVLHKPGYGFAVSMFSPRITAFEFNKGENRQGWYTGMGMTTLYDNDLLQFSEDYWATVDMYRLPGTTTDGAPSDAPVSEHLYFNPKKWVGGATLDGEFSAVGMDFSLDESTGSWLQAKKSWFVMQGAIYCMGSDISNGVNRDVETIVENRRLRGGGAERVLTVDGDVKPSTVGWGATLGGVKQVHISGVDGAPGVSYVFPGSAGAKIAVKREARTGVWSDVSAGESTEPRTNTFLSISIPHGYNPKGASYDYIIVPGETAHPITFYNNVDKLNNQYVHAVWQNVKNTYYVRSANFWLPHYARYIRALTPLSIVVKEDLVTKIMYIAISDPTQSQSKVRLELTRTPYMPGGDYEVVSHDDEVTVKVVPSTDGMFEIEVDTAGAQGATFHAVVRPV